MVEIGEYVDCLDEEKVDQHMITDWYLADGLDHRMLGEREDVEGLTGLHLTDGEWHGSAAELLYVQNGKVKG